VRHPRAALQHEQHAHGLGPGSWRLPIPWNERFVQFSLFLVPLGGLLLLRGLLGGRLWFSIGALRSGHCVCSCCLCRHVALIDLHHWCMRFMRFMRRIAGPRRRGLHDTASTPLEPVPVVAAAAVDELTPFRLQQCPTGKAVRNAAPMDKAGDSERSAGITPSPCAQEYSDSDRRLYATAHKPGDTHSPTVSGSHTLCSVH